MKWLALLSAVLFSAAAMPSAQASDEDCFRTAATRYRIDTDLLLAIAKVESNFDARAVHYNSDGTYDLGVMQINSRHLSSLLEANISENTLLDHPCTNVEVGASILAGFVRKFGPTWRAVGAYGAGALAQREEARREYAAKVASALARVRGRLPPLALRRQAPKASLLVLN